jgi:hypothetical protein
LLKYYGVIQGVNPVPADYISVDLRKMLRGDLDKIPIFRDFGMIGAKMEQS